MSALGILAPGLGDPSHDAQQLFRAVLDAASHPGRIVSLAPTPEGPGTLSRAAAAYLLTLADGDTPVWLARQVDRPEVRDFLRFHAGVPLTAMRGEALFAVLAGAATQLFEGFSVGTDPYPDRSATLVIEVPDLRNGPPTRWRGPGIDGSTSVAIGGLAGDFWLGWDDNHGLFPCGVDLVFTAGTELCALPRSIAVEV